MTRPGRWLRQAATDRVEAVIPSMFDPDEMIMTDVELRVEKGPNLHAHKLILSTSPVLKAALTNIDVRICPIPVIYIQGFHRESVQNLLQFLYKGVIDMAWGSEIHEDFMALCKTLRMNPPVVKTLHGSNWEPNSPTGNEGDVRTNSPTGNEGDVSRANSPSDNEADVRSNSPSGINEGDVSDLPNIDVNGETALNKDDGGGMVGDGHLEVGGEMVEDDHNKDGGKMAENDHVEVASNAILSMDAAEEKEDNGVAMEDDAQDDVEADVNCGENDIEMKEIDVKEYNSQGEEEEEIDLPDLESGDQIGQEEDDDAKEENNNVTPEFVNIDELGLDTSSEIDDASVNNDDESVSKDDEPDSATVIDKHSKDLVIEDDNNSSAKLVNEQPNVICEEKNNSSDERTGQFSGAGDKLEEICDKDSLKDDARDSQESVKDATTEIVKSKPERYVCDICVEVFSVSKHLDEHKQNIHLIDEISDDDTQEETIEAMSDFLSKDLGVKLKDHDPEPKVSGTQGEDTEFLNIKSESVSTFSFGLGETSGRESPSESDPFEFKMPDSFDLSVDYIKEIVPSKASIKVEYKGSDDEKENTDGFIGLNKLEFKMPLSDLCEDLSEEELDNQPVPDETPSIDLGVSPTETSSRHQVSSSTDNNVEAITYKKDKSSKSLMRSREKPLQSRRDRKKKDRKLMNSLFGSDDIPEGTTIKKERNLSPTKDSWAVKKERPSSSCERKSSKSSRKERRADDDKKSSKKERGADDERKSPKKEKVVDDDRKLSTPSPDCRSSSPTRTPTPTMSITEELKEKRERMMRKMKFDDDEKLDEKFDEKKEKRSRMKESSPRKKSSIGGTPKKASHLGTHHKGCNSSCQIDHRFSDEESWLVPDDYESSSDSSVDLLDDLKVKLKKMEESPHKPKSKAKAKPVEVKSEAESEADFIDDEDDDSDDEDEEAKRKREKRLSERKKKAGGDILFWMNPGHKSKVKVKVQMYAKEDIMDMNYYKMKLLADEGSDTDVETPRKDLESDGSSVASSKRSKSPDYVKRMLDSDTDNSVKRKKHKKRKKKKRHSSNSNNGSPGSIERIKRPVSDSSDDDVKPSEVEVWTPMRFKTYNRSVSNVSSFGESSKRSNSFVKPVIQRSISTLESLGISHNYGLSSTPKSVSSMPKIPKIVKPSTEMPKIPKIEKSSTTEMPKIPKMAKIPKI